MYVVGGGSYEPEGPHLDVFRLHLAPSSVCGSTKARPALEWERLHPTGSPPRCRAAHGLAWDRVGRAAYIWGGFTSRMELDSTFCALRLPPAPAPTNAPPPPGDMRQRQAASPLQVPHAPAGGTVASATVAAAVPASSWSSAVQDAVSHSRAASVDGGDFIARTVGYAAAAAAGGDNRDRAADRVRYAVRQALAVSVLAAVGNNKPSGGGGGGMNEPPAAPITADIAAAVVSIDDVVNAQWQRQQQQLLSRRNPSPARPEPARNPNGRGHHGRERWRRRGQHLWRPAGEHGTNNAGLQQPQQRQHQPRRRSSRGGAGRRRTWGQGWASGRLQGLWRGGAVAASPAPAVPAGQGPNTASPSPSPSPPPPSVVFAAAAAAAAMDPQGGNSPQQLPPMVSAAATMPRGQHGHTTGKEELAWVSLPSGSVADAAAAAGPAPAGRSFHCTFFYAGACYVTGGSDGARKFGDMWRFAARETPPPLTTLAARAVILAERAAAAAVANKDKTNKNNGAVGQPNELGHVGDDDGDDDGVRAGESQFALLPAELRAALETINMQAQVVI